MHNPSVVQLSGDRPAPAGSLIARDNLPFLESARDRGLQAGLESCLVDLGLNGPADNETVCVALVGISDSKSPRLAMVNGEHMMYSASLPKIAILLGAFDRIDQGTIVLDSPTQTLLEKMIRNSSNPAATEMLNRVGTTYLADLLQSSRYRFYDPAHNGGLWVGKPYGQSPAFRRDPLHNISHGAKLSRWPGFIIFWKHPVSCLRSLTGR